MQGKDQGGNEELLEVNLQNFREELVLRKRDLKGAAQIG